MFWANKANKQTKKKERKKSVNFLQQSGNWPADTPGYKSRSIMSCLKKQNKPQPSNKKVLFHPPVSINVNFLRKPAEGLFES